MIGRYVVKEDAGSLRGDDFDLVSVVHGKISVCGLAKGEGARKFR